MTPPRPRPRAFTLTAADLAWSRLIASLKQADALAARGDLPGAAAATREADRLRAAWRRS